MSTTRLFSSKDYDKLAKPFDEKTLGVKAQAFSRDRTKVMLVPYIRHTDSYERIESVDPSWSSQVTHVEQMRIGEGDKAYMVCFAVVALTVLGVTRTNTGEGDDLKSATSDGIKRAAMLFGVGRYLYDAVGVWAPYSDVQDRYRVWTYDDYEAARRNDQPQIPIGNEPAGPAAESSEPRRKSKQEVEDEVMGLSKDLGWDERRTFDEAETFTGKDLDNISMADLERFASHLHALKMAKPSRRGFGR